MGIPAGIVPTARGASGRFRTVPAASRDRRCIIAGTLELRIDGQEPRRVSAGEAYHNARGVIHETRNVGDIPARVASTFVIEKGKPVTQPVK